MSHYKYSEKRIHALRSGWVAYHPEPFLLYLTKLEVVVKKVEEAGRVSYFYCVSITFWNDFYFLHQL